MGGQHADAETIWGPIDLGFETLAFPVHERYRVEERFGRPVVVAEGNVRRRWVPEGGGWIAELIEISDSDQLIGWIRECGLLGLRPRATEESIDADLRAIGTLRTATRLVDDLVHGRPPSAADLGALYDPARVVEDAGIGPEILVTAESDAKLAALDVLARTIATNIRDRTTMSAEIVADGPAVRIVPRVVVLTPIGLAWTEMLAAVSRLRVGVDADFLPELRPPSICAACRRLFFPRRTDQTFCSRRCRWRQQKRWQRGAA